jgi:putative acyl-CoA dehydrogenase
VAREGAADALAHLGTLGALASSAEAREHARLADTHPPVLRTHDRYGHRIDEVEYHPSWHWLMGRSVGWGLHGRPWLAEPGSGAHVARAAGFYLMSQLEAGHCCPISMSYAAVPALRADPALSAAYVPGLQSQVYEFGLTDPSRKAGLLAGMSMTEKQGGSDVRAGSTTAAPVADGTYRLTGHKWFTSAPMNDLFLTLAQAPGGLTCFVLPRVLPDGTRNAIHLQRLKDKLGNRSNASAELEYTGATGWRLGEEGRGVTTIIEMVSMTRLDCVLGSAAVVRAALSEAAHHVAHRRAFGSVVGETPLMRTVIADLALESEAATALGIRLAGAVDRAEHAFLRLALPASKYLVCKRAPAAVAEALECLGGNGYVEESGMPRLYREARSTRSGRARATSPRSTSCARSPGNRTPWRPSWPRSTSRAAPTSGSTAASTSCAWSCAAGRSAGRGGSPRCSRCACRAACCCGSRPWRCRARSCRAGSCPTGRGGRRARCPRSRTSRR